MPGLALREWLLWGVCTVTLLAGRFESRQRRGWSIRRFISPDSSFLPVTARAAKRPLLLERHLSPMPNGKTTEWALILPITYYCWELCSNMDVWIQDLQVILQILLLPVFYQAADFDWPLKNELKYNLHFSDLSPLKIPWIQRNYSFLRLISGLSEAYTPLFPLQAPFSKAGFLNSCTEVFVISSKAEFSLVTCKNSTEAKQQCPKKKIKFRALTKWTGNTEIKRWANPANCQLHDVL